MDNDEFTTTILWWIFIILCFILTVTITIMSGTERQQRISDCKAGILSGEQCKDIIKKDEMVLVCNSQIEGEFICKPKKKKKDSLKDQVIRRQLGLPMRM